MFGRLEVECLLLINNDALECMECQLIRDGLNPEGCLLFFPRGKDAFKEVQLLCHKYGPVTSFRLCGQLVVVLSTKESIHEATLTQRTLIGRHTMLTNHLLAQGQGKGTF